MGATTRAERSAGRELLPALAALPGHVVWRATARVNEALDEILPPGVDIHSYAVLLALAGGVTRSQQALADTVSVSRTTLAKVAADLADRGLVERVRNPHDRRSYALTRTPDGAATARSWRRHAEDLEDSITAGFTLREREDLRTLLLRVVEPELSPDAPEPLRESIGFLITRLHARMHRDFLAALNPLGIEPRHFGVLAALESTGAISQTELGRAFGVSGASVVQMVDELEERGLVVRRRLETDRRAQVLDLQPRAADVLEAARPAAAGSIEVLLRPILGRRSERLLGLLRRFVVAP